MTDILDTAWQQSLNAVPKKTISRDEAITLLKKHHVYSTDSIDDAYHRSCDYWNPTNEEVEALRKKVQGMSDEEIQAELKRMVSDIYTQSVDGIDHESAVMVRIHSDAERRRTTLISEGVSCDEVDRRVAFYIAERKRLDGIGI
ncbi:hypothetical protein PP836_004706 [Salmonella enterica]|nr:hypothetical protein [Salmonella enterica subsp. diarizonae]EGV3636096.1 hypothetical protein [Salmonella enterica]EKL0444602.1 hypothetical protein [Salmonella enterica]HCM1889873.1 hypothetical protein [Salmonella enterica subsp. diarizonae serovar 57:c:z]